MSGSTESGSSLSKASLEGETLVVGGSGRAGSSPLVRMVSGVACSYISRCGGWACLSIGTSRISKSFCREITD
jgi:hypothetical protein